MERRILLIPYKEFHGVLQEFPRLLDSVHGFPGSLEGDPDGFVGAYEENSDICRSPLGKLLKTRKISHVELAIDPKKQTWTVTPSTGEVSFSGTLKDLPGDLFNPGSCYLEIQEPELSFSISSLVLNDFLVSHGWISGKTCDQLTSELSDKIRAGKVDLREP